MFDRIPKSKFDIVASDGTLRGQVDAIATGKEIIIPDETVVVQAGDEMRRSLPNGTDETFDVIDPVFVQKTFGIPGHFQVQVRKKGMLPHGAGGNYTVSVNGPNSRVNINSIDRSTNINIDQSIISKLRNDIIEKVDDPVVRSKLVDAIDDMEKASDKPSLSKAYQKLISSASDHMGVIAPFLPALGQMFGG